MRGGLRHNEVRRQGHTGFLGNITSGRGCAAQSDGTSLLPRWVAVSALAYFRNDRN